MKQSSPGLPLVVGLLGVLAGVVFAYGGLGGVFWLVLSIGALFAFGVAWDRFEWMLERILDAGGWVLLVAGLLVAAVLLAVLLPGGWRWALLVLMIGGWPLFLLRDWER